MMPLILHLPEVKKEAKIALEHVHDIGYVHGVVKTAISVNRGELKGAALEKALAHILQLLLVPLHARSIVAFRQTRRHRSRPR